MIALGRHVSGHNSGMDAIGITEEFLIGLKPHATGGDSFLVL